MHIDEVDIAILTKIDADLSCTADIDPEVRQRCMAGELGVCVFSVRTLFAVVLASCTSKR